VIKGLKEACQSSGRSQLLRPANHALREAWCDETSDGDVDIDGISRERRDDTKDVSPSARVAIVRQRREGHLDSYDNLYGGKELSSARITLRTCVFTCREDELKDKARNIDVIKRGRQAADAKVDCRAPDHIEDSIRENFRI
jgi:uncharacterized protein (DUF885 family)